MTNAMIRTGEFKMYGQIEDLAERTADIDAFVFRNGNVVPADQPGTESAPEFHTAPEKNYGQLEEMANGNVDVNAFVYRDGEVIPEEQAEEGTDPGFHTAPEKNYAYGKKAEGGK